jgi:hypothetical protein
MQGSFASKCSAGLFALCLFVYSGLASAALIGVNWGSGDLFSVNETTGATVALSRADINHIGALEYDSYGSLYGITTGSSSALYQIDANTGVTTAIGPLGVGFVFEGGLTFGSGGTAYGVNYGNASNPGLFSINLSTGAATEIGILSGGAHDFNGLTMRSDGMLVGLDRETDTLRLIDPLTAITSLLAVTPNVGDVGGFTSDGINGYFSNSANLYAVDLYTGAFQLVGNTGVEFSGLASTAVPIPPAVWLFGSGLAALVRFRRRRN